MIKFQLSHAAYKQLCKLDRKDRERLEEKIIALKSHPSFTEILEPVHEIPPATHRVRVGDYRLLVCKEGENWLILRIGHRRDVYKF